MAKVVVRAGKVIVTVSFLLAIFAILGFSVFSKAEEDVILINTEAINGLGQLETDLSSDILIAKTKSELTEYRKNNRRVWQVTNEILSKDPITDQPVIIEEHSRIIEVGDALCYRDDLGNWQTTNARWLKTETGYEMTEAMYSVFLGQNLGSWLEYIVEGKTMFLRPEQILADDGINTQIIGQIDESVEGQIDPNDLSRLVFNDAFGKGIDLELILGNRGYHQNVIFRTQPELSKDLDPVITRFMIYTELDMADYDSDESIDLETKVDSRIKTKDIAETDITEDYLTFFKKEVKDDKETEYAFNAFGKSAVFDDSPVGIRKHAFASKQLFKDKDSGCFLVEQLDGGFFEDAVFPVTWDYVTIADPCNTLVTITTDTIWYAANTYLVSDNVTVSNCELKIEPGTVVKFENGKKLSVSGTGKIIAKGLPNLDIIFTSKYDSYNGETISTGSYGKGSWQGIELGDDSEFENCSVFYSSTAVKLLGLPASSIKNNKLLINYTALYVGPDIFSDGEDELHIFNNLIVPDPCAADPCDYAIVICDPCSIAANIFLYNNTINRAGHAIHVNDGAVSPRNNIVIADNLMTNSSVGIYVTSTFDPNCMENAWNGYYNNTNNTSGPAWFSTDANSVSLSQTPYASSDLGSYYLNTNASGGDLLIDAGSRLVEDIENCLVDPNEWTVYRPEETSDNVYDSTTTISTDTTWSPNYDICDSNTVDIGYHSPRIDYFIDYANITVDGSTGPRAVLTIEPGTVVAHNVNLSTGAGLLMIEDNGGLECVGDPFGGGCITWVGGNRTSHNLNKGYLWGTPNKPTFEVKSSGQYDVRHARFMALSRVFILRNGNGIFRDNEFYINSQAFSLPAADNGVFENCLFNGNRVGFFVNEGNSVVIRNCTFDVSLCSIYITGSTGSLDVYNNIFSEHEGGYAIRQYGSVTCNEQYNLFYNVDYPYDLGGSTGSLDSTDYADPSASNAQTLLNGIYDPDWTDFSERFCIIQDFNHVDIGLDYDSGISGMYGYTTSLDGRHDVNSIDIGYHYPKDGDLDGDGIRDFEEFWQGTDPSNSDTDYDGLSDGDELYTYGTDPLDWDTDGDGMPDGWEVDNNLDPKEGGEESADGANGDPDSDGYSNLTEYVHGSDPQDNEDIPEPMVISVPVNFTTIQGAIDYSINGDIVEVQSGTYQENIDFKGKGIYVTSLAPFDQYWPNYGYWYTVDQTVITADSNSLPVVTFSNDPNDDAVFSLICGFTIEGGDYGIKCSNSTDDETTIMHCKIKDSQNSGVYCYSGMPLIQSCQISSHPDSGVECQSGNPYIINNWIHDNTGKGIEITSSSVDAVIRNNTIVNNNGGISAVSGSDPAISNCILWDNTTELDGCDATYSCIEDGDPNSSNIISNPLLINVGNGQYFLDPNSPCIDAGSNSLVGSGEADIDGRIRIVNSYVDIGASEYLTGLLPEMELLPYTTSFEYSQGYEAYTTLHLQNDWQVEEGIAVVEYYYFFIGERYTFLNCAVIEPNSVVTKSFDSKDLNDTHIRCTIKPYDNSEFEICHDANTVASVHFDDDGYISVLNYGSYKKTSTQWDFYRRTWWYQDEMVDWGKELRFEMDYSNSGYSVYYAGSHVADANFVGEFDTLTDVRISSGSHYMAFDRFSISSEANTVLDIQVTSPCACSEEELSGKIPVKGKLWMDNLECYYIKYCPADTLDTEGYEDIYDALEHATWYMADWGYNVVEDGGILGWWDTSQIPNGAYYLSIDIIQDNHLPEESQVVTTDIYIGEGEGKILAYSGPKAFVVTGDLKCNSFNHVEEPDISVPWPGKFPFEFRRMYDSNRRFIYNSMGYGWTNNNHILLTEDTTYYWESVLDGGQLEPAHQDNDNWIGFGYIWITYPDGRKKLFIRDRDNQDNLTTDNKYVPYASNDNTGEYIIRTAWETTENGSSVISDIQYELYSPDGMVLTFDTGDVTNEEIPVPVDYGAVGWTLKAPIETMSDIYENMLIYTWNSDKTAVTNITDGNYSIKLQTETNSYTGEQFYTGASLYIGDPNSAAETKLKEVNYDILWYLNEVTHEGYIADENGDYVYDQKAKNTAYEYNGTGSLEFVCYDSAHYYPNVFFPDIWVEYDEFNRPSIRHDIIEHTNLYYWYGQWFAAYWDNIWKDTEFSYEFYRPFEDYPYDPNDPDDKQYYQYLITMATTGNRTVETEQDNFGAIVRQTTTTVDESVSVETKSKYSDNNNRLKPTKTTEFFDSFTRKTYNTYDLDGNLTESRLYVDSSHYIASEMDYHEVYPFPTRKTSWQEYNKQAGSRMETQYVYGTADGTESQVDDPNGMYLVTQKMVLDDNEIADANYSDSWDWAVTKMYYEENGLIRKIIDPESDITWIEYNDVGLPIEVTKGNADANDIQQRTLYDDLGQAILTADAKGAVKYNQFDDMGRLWKTRTYSDPNACEISYSQFTCLRYFDPNSYDPNDFSDPNDAWGPYEPLEEVIYGYDCRGNKVYQKTATGGEIVSPHLASGLPASIQFDDGSYINYYYLDSGKKYAEVHGDVTDGKYWDLAFGYDDMDRLIAQVHYADANSLQELSATYEKLKEVYVDYYESGQKKNVTLFGNVSSSYETAVQYEYNILGNKTKQIVDPNGLALETQWDYDAAGNMVKLTDPNGNYVYSVFDNANRKVTESFATSGSQTIAKSMEYYSNGKLKQIKQWDYNGTSLLSQKDLEYDFLGRTTEVTELVADSNEAVTEYDYFDSGTTYLGDTYHIRITDAENKQTYIQTDSFGNRTKILYPSGDYQQYEYYADGSLGSEAVWDSNDVKYWIDYTYDSYGRIDEITYPDDGYVEFSYDGFGRKTSVTDSRNLTDNIGGDSTISWEHDALGRVTKKIDQDDYEIRYSWRADGQKASVRVIEPTVDRTMYYVVNIYDKAGRLGFIFEPLLGETTPWIASFNYDNNGNRDDLTYYLDNHTSGDIAQIDYSYNMDNRLIGYSTTGGPTFSLSNVTVDGLGRLTAGTEVVTKTDSSTVSHVHSYTYDMRSQLTIAKATNVGSDMYHEYTSDYDKAGNRESKEFDNSGVDNTTNYTYNGDMVTQATGYGSGSLTTDSNGRQTSLLSADPNNYTLEYTWEGKLAKGTFGSSSYQLECKYSPSGTRIYKKRTWPSDSYEHKYVVDDTGRLPQVLLAVDLTENDPNDAIAKTFIYANNQVIAQHDGFYGDAIYFYLHDRLGSVRALIDADGDVANCYYYDPWGKTGGETNETIDNLFTFAGYWYDSEVDLFYCNARMYDPTLARFTSRDPYSGSFDSPMELHRYLYCVNDPMNRIDPSGEFSGTLTELVGTQVLRGAVLGMISGTYGGCLKWGRTGDWHSIWKGTISGGLSGAIGGGFSGLLSGAGLIGQVIAGGIGGGSSHTINSVLNNDYEHFGAELAASVALGGIFAGVMELTDASSALSSNIVGNGMSPRAFWQSIEWTDPVAAEITGGLVTIFEELYDSAKENIHDPWK